MNGGGMDTKPFPNFRKRTFRADVISNCICFQIVADSFSRFGRACAKVFAALMAKKALSYFGNDPSFRLHQRLDKTFALGLKTAVKGASFFSFFS